MSHEPWSDSPASYALGALPDEEAEAFEAHLATCAACRAELEELLPAVHALPASVEPVPPPPALKARIMAEVEREAALLAAAGPEADRPARARRRRSWRPRLGIPRAALAGALAALVVGIGAGVAIDRSTHDRARTVPATMASHASGARAEVDLNGGNATLVASGLHPAPGGRVYQVWLQRPGHAPEPTSALFMPKGDGSATATVPGPLAGVRDVLVTDEPPGGSQSPTGKLLLQARIGS